MRFIEKKAKCVAFEFFLEKEKPQNWGDLRDPVKKKLEDHLLAEQKSLCIYCQQKLAPKPSKENRKGIWPAHIEHIRPKEDGQFPELKWQHSNLSISCEGQNVEEKYRFSNHFCGKHKDRKGFHYIEGLFLHPFEEKEMEAFFKYDEEGRIFPTAKDHEKASKTIEILNLDCEELNSLRKKEIEVFAENMASGEIDTVDFLAPTQPELPKFFSMLRQLFGLA